VVKSGATCKPNEIATQEGCKPKKEDVVRVATTSVKGALVAPVAAGCADTASCQAACDKGEANGCLGLGGFLRAGLKQGTPSEDGKRAQAAFQKACDGGEATACTALGEMLYQGLGVSKDTNAATPLLEKACTGGDPAGCNDLGLARSLSGDAPGAAKYFQMACNAKTQLGCLGLGTLYRDGKGVAKDPAKAKDLFKKACDGKVAAACKLL
jgi:TPR repeat protein